MNVSSICGPISKTEVTFLADNGGVVSEDPNDFSAPRNEKLSVATDAQGNATCFWRLAPLPDVQQLRASVTPNPGEPWEGPT